MAGHIKVATPKLRKRLKRKVHIRLRVTGTSERPRLSVFRSSRYAYAQAIDDTTGRVLASASELDASLKDAVAGKPKKERARLVGKVIGEKLMGQASRRSCSTATVSSITVASRSSPTALVTRAWRSKETR